MTLNRRASLISLAALLAAAPALAQDRSAQAPRVHDRTLVLDAHVDLPAPYDWNGAAAPAPTGQDDASIDLLRAGGVDAAIVSVFVPQGPRTPEAYARARAEADAKLDAILALASNNPGRVEIARTPRDVRRIAGAGRTAIVVGLLNVYPFGEDVGEIARLHARGVRVLGFTHAGNNAFADSSRPQPRDQAGEHGGLSPLGRAAVAEANRLGILLDVSQLSTPALLQTVALSRAPVIASHSGVRGRVDSPRNLTDEELDAIRAKGGVVGVVAFSSYLRATPPEVQAQIREIRARYGAVNGYEGLTAEQRQAMGRETQALQPRATVSEFVDSIDYAIRRIGVDHVAIASDFNHGGGVEGWRNAGEARAVTAELLRRGYSNADIAKLWSGNVLRVLGQAQALAAQS
ncbi:MAG: dipeptidase [Hyphomonadaceae bacterium]|nr:dipeptidase [Hyphomonadaceae bacterium]